MIKTLVLSILVCLLLQLSSASAANYVLPIDIVENDGSGPFKDCSAGPGQDTFTCTEKVDIGKNNTLVITDDVTLNIDGEFKVADDSSVDNNGHVFNVNATKLHIDGAASMVFNNLTATGKVHIHKQANLTANVTSTDGEIKIDGGNNTIYGNVTANSGNLNIDSDSTVNGTCSPSNSQCTPLPSMVNPTVVSQTTTDTTPIIYGTYSSSVATSLNVTVNSVTYVLSSSSELTNSSDNWTLDLRSITPLPLGAYDVAATSADADGNLSDTSNNELVIEEAQWWDTNWTKCRNIIIANTGTTTLSNFPAYIDLAFDSDMQSNYHDIRFINTSCANGGVELDFEIETYTAEASADVWVEIDNLPAAGTTIAVYYGNASATSGENVNGTWVSSHKGVWHLSDKSTDLPNQDSTSDSTSNSNHGTPQSSPASTSGKIGKALDFDVGDNTSIELGTDDSLDLSTGNSPNWTISLWVKPASGFVDNDYPVMYAYGDYLATVGLDKDNGKIEHRRNDDNSPLYNDNNLTTDAWHHVVVTRDNSFTTFYLNGNANGSRNVENITGDSYGSFIGGWTGTDSDDTYKAGDLKGVIDEVRVSNVVRSPDWIKQSYDLVQDQNDHVTIGDEVEAQLGPKLTGSLHVDNTFEAYISTDDSVQGILLTSGNDWQTTYALASSLLEGQDYYLHIKATDTGGKAGFLGDFELTDTSHRFSNGLTTLNTNTVNWSVSTTEWSNYISATSYGTNGIGPWGARSGVNSSAQWIWSSDNSADDTAYFSTKIVAALPVLEYRFDELSWYGTAGELIDSSINSLNGQSVGGTLSEDAQLCTGATFDGVNDHFVVPPMSTDFSSGFSAMAWVDFGSANNWERIFDFGNGAANNNIVFARQGSTNNLLFEIFNGGASCGKIQADNGIVSGRHHYAVAVASDNTVVLYRDGAAIKSGTTACLPPNVTRNINYIGRSNWNNEYFESEIDELKIFDSTLTATNISNIYNNENAGNNYDGTTRSCPVIACGTLNAVGIKIGSGGGSSDSQINTTSEALAIHAAWLTASSPATGSIDTGGDTYNVTASGLSEVDRIDFGGSSKNFAGTLPYPGADTGVGGEDFLVHTSGTLSLPTGDYTIYVSSDDGFSFVMDTLKGDTVSFSKFGSSSSGANNELRYENPTGNSNTGGSFTLTEDSVFDISAIFFERGGGDYLEISIINDIRSNSSSSDYEILRHDALNEKVKFGQCAVTSQIDHYRIEHDAQGFTCEAETVSIKACADANCDTSHDQEATITLSDLGLAGDGWMSGNEITIPAGTDIEIILSITDERSVTFSTTSAYPNANLRCFNGSTETCDMTFSDDGFEIYGASIGEPLADQLAADHFQNVNLRAVRSNNNVCEALLVGTQTVDLTYNCVLPNECVTPLSDIAINGDGSGDNTGTLSVVFDDQGVANLSGLNYPDAGRLTLSVTAEVEGVTIEDSSDKTVDVYPSYLQLAVSQNSSIAAEPFTLSIGAYGVNDALLPNYKAGASKLKIKRVTPNSSDAHDGNFKYGDASTSIMTTDLAATFASTSPYPLVFNGGVYSSTQAYFDDVGSVEIDIQDANYLGNIIPSQGALSIGNFVPAYFSVTQMQPELQDTCEDTFSYIGETMGFVTGLEPLLIFTGKNALDAVTKNYSASPWTFNLDQLDVNNGIHLSDSSTYAAVDSFNEISKGSPPVISTGSAVYDGIIEVQIPNTRFKYNKIRTDNTTFNIKSPFTASIDMVFSSAFLTDEDGVCFQTDYANSNCLSFTIPNITGANMRYGRLALASTYGPETESLNVPVKVEYVDTNNQWLINSEDNCTNINFLETSGDIILESIGSVDITEDIIDISSNGLLFEGVSNDSANFLLINSENKIGEVRLRLSPTASGVVWPTYLNYDWDGDGSIDTNDFPEANVTFGQFRGNDKIIQWREVFN
jgi:hypothetical protein